MISLLEEKIYNTAQHGTVTLIVATSYWGDHYLSENFCTCGRSAKKIEDTVKNEIEDVKYLRYWYIAHRHSSVLNLKED